MNSDIIEGKWSEIKGKARAKWGKLTDDDIDRVQGRREELSGALQKKYGYKKDEAEREIDGFVNTLN